MSDVRIPRYFARPDEAGFFVSGWVVYPGDPMQPLPTDVEVTADQLARLGELCLLDGRIAPRPARPMTRVEVERERGLRYLAAWPLASQAEAHAEAAAGRPEKLALMLVELAAIKAILPYPEDDDGAV